MTRNEAGSRISSITSSSTDSGRSGVTVKSSIKPAKPTHRPSAPPTSQHEPVQQHEPAPQHSSPRRPRPSRLKTEENGRIRSVKEEPQISPTTPAAPTSRLALSPASPASNASNRDHNRLSDFANYRRDLAVLDPSGGRVPQIQHNPPTANSMNPVAPWMSGNGSGAPTPSKYPTTSFYNDSSDNLSVASQLSPGFQLGNGRHVQATPSNDSPDPGYNDERRPSLASIATASSQGSSKASLTRGGFRKLQAIFGEEFPGRDSSDSSVPVGQGKEQRSRSYSHSRPHRDRNYSNATDHTRDASPASSRPRTPVPAPEVVPFLYQDSDDIARFGEAPVRDILSGPDRERFASDASSQIPPKTSSSSRSGHSIVHLPGHHRHNRSIDDSRSLRPTVSRDESAVSLATYRDRGGSTATSAPGSRSRAQSPTPSGHSGTYSVSKEVGMDGQTSPGHHRKGFLNRLRGKRDHKEEDSKSLKKLPTSTHSLAPSRPRQEFPKADASPGYPNWASSIDYGGETASLRPGTGARQATFNNKFPFSKKGRCTRAQDDPDEAIGPTDRKDPGTQFHLDTDLTNMDGILSKPPPLTPMDATTFMSGFDQERPEPKPEPVAEQDGKWDAPDSWAVKKTGDEVAGHHVPDIEDVGSPAKPEEKKISYCIRIFRLDGTFATLSMALDASVHDVIGQIGKKWYFTEAKENYHIMLKRHDIVRILNSAERPILIQKRLLQQVGYEDRDRIEEIGREDNSYLCRFLFLSERDGSFHAITHDFGLGRMQKFNHVDLSGRNLITIPISLYSKAQDIISLNLSRNLSMDLPRDFIQSCSSLRDIKFTNNEARRLPPSLSRANKLTYLDVSNNRLEHLEQADLHDLSGLLRINLANNRLKELPFYFGHYRFLRTLNLSSNFLEVFPGFLCGLESLIDLDLSFNLIASFPKEIGLLRNLEKLVITNNRLSGKLPATFSQLQSLRELDVKYNALRGIDVVSELSKLEILAADHNDISQFVGSFERLRSLKLNGNPLTKFDINSPVPTLKLLNLSNAMLASIDTSFNNMLNLERLVLDKNNFVSFPGTIGNLRKLEHFSVAKNSVQELPPEIGCLGELKDLDVHGNNIKKLPMELWWANKLEILNASSNVLEAFPKPASRPPQAPGEATTPLAPQGHKPSFTGSLSPSASSEDLLPDGTRRPSHSSSTLLSVGPSPVPGGPDRKSSLVSVYGKGGRKTSVVSRSATQNNGATTPSSTTRKDSGLSTKLTSTFAGSLRNLYLADNSLDDEVFEQITTLSELRVLNLSYNDISDMPQKAIKSWHQLVELYLSGNELTTLPIDDLEESSFLQVLHINGNKFTNLPADISRAKKLAILDCGNNYLKYNISNVPYDWNWNLNPNLRYLNLSGNRRLEIKQTVYGAGAANREQYTDFSRLLNLRVLGLMDVTLTQPSIPDQSEDRRVRTSGSIAGFLPYGMADTLGKYEHLSTIDLVVPRFNSSETETLLGLFDGQALSSGGSKIAKYLHENFGHIFTMELKGLKTRANETPEDALRRAFLALNKDLVTVAIQHSEERPMMTHRGSAAPVVLSKEDLNSGGVATVVYLQGQELYVANVGDVQGLMLQTDGSHKMLTRKHDPAEPSERSRIRDAGGWVSRNGRLNDLLEVSRAFGYVDLMPAVQAAPHVTHVTVRDQDDIILIATRELWEFLEPNLIVDVVRSIKPDLMSAAHKLRDLAMAYGASGKIMVMMISVADLKRRSERSRLHRGTSMSLYPSGVPDDFVLPARRTRPKKGDVLDSNLQRLEAEVPAPTGMIAIVFTDIKNSTNLWETYPTAMRSAIRMHNVVMRRQLRRIGGFEVKTEGDAFMVSFPTATSALLWCFSVQIQLLEVNWPSEMLNSMSCQATFDKDSNMIFRGLSVRMGIHWGEPLAEPDPVTRRMDYYGPMVNKASRISSVADGGQITVSSDFISEIQRCLETYQEAAAGADEIVDDDSFAQAIRKELKSLSSQGFEVKEMGERKLKGLENPEYIYTLYPHALTGRFDYHHTERVELAEKPATLSSGSEIAFDPNTIWALWRVSLRLEMLCSSLEEVSGRGLQPPETELLERMKQKGGEVTERFLLHFMEHQVSRIETCISTLFLRHMEMGGGRIAQLDDLRKPMKDVLDNFEEQMSELQRYRDKYGPLSDEADDD